MGSFGQFGGVSEFRVPSSLGTHVLCATLVCVPVQAGKSSTVMFFDFVTGGRRARARKHAVAVQTPDDFDVNDVVHGVI